MSRAAWLITTNFSTRNQVIPLAQTLFVKKSTPFFNNNLDGTQKETMRKSEMKSSAFPAALNYQWVIFAILSSTHMVMAMFFYSWGPLAPILKEEALINNSQFGLIVSTMYFVMVIISIPSGFLTDK
ncbi:MAG: hypothetical protein COX19_03305 [Desulfobacterales bacterium CG23_combo_of_CG06-09_8_20_14_all_51_8]|nr:MAG: hypothetical protein COX19_03305 [Desulfobacterales bacterium CG23_combo_of_CG06-09_8_20_14_all_51_8]